MPCLLTIVNSWNTRLAGDSLEPSTIMSGGLTATPQPVSDQMSQNMYIGCIDVQVQQEIEYLCGKDKGSTRMRNRCVCDPGGPVVTG